MPVSLFMDVHVPQAITDQLRLRGVDVMTAQEDGSDELDDTVLLARDGDAKDNLHAGHSIPRVGD